jgi:hypothetical protein
VRNLFKKRKISQIYTAKKNSKVFPIYLSKKQQNFAIEKNTSCDAAYSTISVQALVYERCNRMVASEQDMEPFFKQFCSNKNKISKLKQFIILEVFNF